MIKSFVNPIKELFKGLFIVLKNGLKPDVTLQYPEEKKTLNENFRGKIKYNKEKCIKCAVCTRVCPSKGAVFIKNNEFTLDYAQCIYCYNCVENCSKNALERTSEFELAALNKEELILKEELN